MDIDKDVGGVAIESTRLLAFLGSEVMRIEDESRAARKGGDLRKAEFLYGYAEGISYACREFKKANATGERPETRSEDA